MQFKQDARLREAMIVYVATHAHGAWRKDYRARSGDTPNEKTTIDEAWIKANGTDQVDIASLEFPRLPSDWQRENRLSAEVAVDVVLMAADHGVIFGDGLIDMASDEVHKKWLERNAAHASDMQKLPYAELPDDEKEKDRLFVRAAISAFAICRAEAA
jgi:hypothetical protein